MAFDDPLFLKYARGVFRPLKTHDLREGSMDLIGETMVWQYGWIIEDGPYAGQHIMQPGRRAPFAWTPECDVELAADQSGDLYEEFAEGREYSTSQAAAVSTQAATIKMTNERVVR